MGTVRSAYCYQGASAVPPSRDIPPGHADIGNGTNGNPFPGGRWKVSGSGLNDTVSRLSSMSDSSGTVESYDYLGLGIIVKHGHSQPGVDLTYVKQSGENNGDAGDQYIGLDRFGRVADQRWRARSSDKDRFQYGHDRESNRLYRDNTLST